MEPWGGEEQEVATSHGAVSEPTARKRIDGRYKWIGRDLHAQPILDRQASRPISCLEEAEIEYFFLLCVGLSCDVHAVYI